MTRSNVEIAASFSQRFIESGEVAWDLVADDVEVHDHDMFDAGEYRGHSGLARWLQDWSDAWVEWTMELQGYDEVDHRVLVLARMKARGASGVAVERDDAIVYELRDGRIDRIDYFNNQARARAVFDDSAAA